MKTRGTSYSTHKIGLRGFALWSALAAFLLFMSPASFAELAPTYIVCGATPPRPQPPTSCSGLWHIRHAPGAAIESFIGYVEQAPVPGTQPTWLTCNAVRPTPRAPLECSGRWYVRHTPNSMYDRFIGYTYTDQIPDTSPRYIACVPVPPTPKATPSCQNHFYATSDSSRPFASFMGYVYIEPPLTRYGLSPKYYVGSVIYVPPGQGPSTITYGAGTVTGTTLSTDQSWNVQATFGFGFGGGTAQDPQNGTVSFGDAFGGASSTSTDMQIRSSASRTYRGPASNFINHDYDQVVLYFGVQLTANVDYLGNVVWDVDFSQMPNLGFSSSGYPISIGCLRPNSTVPPELCEAALSFLATNNITEDDFQQILRAHPFADPNAPPNPDPDRYVLIDAVNFLPDPTTSTYTYMLSNSSAITNTSRSTFSFTVGLNGSFYFLRNSDTFTFTQSSTESNRTGSDSTSAFTVSLPTAPYNGPATLFVYLDTIYKTFMFSFSR